MNESWRLVVIFCLSVAGIVLSGKLRRIDGYLSVFLAGGFIGSALAHLSSSPFAYQGIFWLPALTLILAVPVRMSRALPAHRDRGAVALVVLNGAHTLTGAAMAALLNQNEVLPLVVWGFAAHELVHKAALVSLLRRSGYSTMHAASLALVSTFFVFGARLMVSVPPHVTELLEKAIVLGLAWLGIAHLMKRTSLPGTADKSLWRLWLPAMAGFCIFALWH